MAFEDLERHLTSLGISPLDGDFEPIGPAIYEPIEAAAGGAFPEVMRWLFSRFGGFSLQNGGFYLDPQTQTDVMVGWFLGANELTEAYEWARESAPPALVPIANDGGDNYLCIELAGAHRGAVSFYPHDAPDGRYRVADSIDAFLRALHSEA